MGDINDLFKIDSSKFLINFPDVELSDYFSIPPYYNPSTNFEDISSFKLEENNKYKGVFHFFEKVTSENVNIDLIEYENKLTINAKYNCNGVNYSTSITETLPNNVDYDTMKAILNNGELIITFDTKNEETTKLDINRIKNK